MSPAALWRRRTTRAARGGRRPAKNGLLDDLRPRLQGSPQVDNGWSTCQTFVRRSLAVHRRVPHFFAAKATSVVPANGRNMVAGEAVKAKALQVPRDRPRSSDQPPPRLRTPVPRAPPTDFMPNAVSRRFGCADSTHRRRRSTLARQKPAVEEAHRLAPSFCRQALRPTTTGLDHQKPRRARRPEPESRRV